MKIKNIISIFVCLWLLVMIVGLSMLFAAFLTGIISKPLLATALDGNVIAAMQVSFFMVSVYLIAWLMTEVLRKIIHKILH